MQLSRLPLILFFLLSLLNFTFPPRVGVGFPDPVASNPERKFYFTESFHKSYVENSANPNISQWAGSYNVHWSGLLITQAILIFALGLLFSLKGFKASKLKQPWWA